MPLDSSHESTDRIEFTDVYVDDDVVEAAEEVLRSTRYVKGPRLEAFEDAYADACGVDHAVGVSSGTAAILLALDAVGVEPGDEVFVPGHTFFASVSPILELGAIPRFVDVDPETYLLDTDALEAAVADSENPAAILPVHIYGQLADLEAVRSIADDHDLAVVEDACQAHFAERDGTVAGSGGDAGAFSFYPSKNMTVGGDGGMLVTDREDVAERARRLRNHGRNADGEHVTLGLNYRMDELKAAVGHEQLRHVDDWNEGRREAAARYTDRLADHPDLETPTAAPGAEHVYHLYVVEVPAGERERIRSALDDRGIDTAVHYETPAHEHPPVVERVGETDLPTTERACDRILSLPMHPRLTDGEVDRVCAALEEVL